MSTPEQTAVKQAIELELATIRSTGEDEENGTDVLKAQLKKAEEMRIILGKAYEDATQLCCDIEIWIESED